MHKKIKYIIAASLIITSISCALPGEYSFIGSTKAYALTYSGASKGQLSSLSLTWGGSNEIDLLDSYYGDKVDLTSKSEYYANIKGINGFTVSADVKGDGYVVKLFTSSSKTEEGKDVGEYMSLTSNYEDIYLRTYKSEDAYKKAYDNGDVTDCENTYVVHVRKETTSSDTEADREYAYLDGIKLSNGDIDFSKDKTSYDVNVDENVDKLTVTANPDDDTDYVEINGASVYKDDDFEKTVDLNKGSNTIKIYVQHDNEDTTYTLNVYRGKLASTGTSSSKDSTVQFQGSNLNTWQKVDGKWKYIDGTGEPLKNEWWFDKDTGMNYYLGQDGYRTTGWSSVGNNWYYFNENGEMQTGWVNVNKNWYYLNKSGAMQMGWLEDASGNWYYLDGSGAMKTGWVESSDGKWYYLDTTGKLARDTTVDGAKIDSNGVMVN